MRLVLEQQQLSIQEKPNQVEWDFELQKEKEKLENERKTFMESAIKLGKERAAFLKEKEEFEKKKNEKNVEQPATPQWLQSMIQKNPLKGNLMFSPIVDKKLNSFKENPFKESSLKENPFKEISFKENPFKENVDPSEETF
ncbi:hypothetical protein ROZALSC1DRAFT_21061 [Rozella allomycis CSF55]|uniref:Uncharacterized protein n=1 Tax=Rozella allomycis (strain CSF55) TaxID=988480 RepID=A0A4P9YQ24_ROZAC|nr:hypothetical protein ROZALSC1DRAFT_21061 [Rozella allomycis CSF55]